MKIVKKISFIYFLPVLFVVLIIISVTVVNSSSHGGSDYYLPLSEKVLSYRSSVEKYCKKYKIEKYVDYILAIMMVETAGEGNDVMACSESLGLPIGSLKPEASIKQGCKVFSEHLSYANKKGCDLNTVIQAYNYGGSFIDYIALSGQKYTFDLACQFAHEKSGGETVAYVNAVSKPYGGWMYTYGNMFYVKLVQQYLPSNASIVDYAKQFIGEDHTRFTSYESSNSQAFESDWCAMFVCYCADKLGYIDKGYLFWFNGCTSAVNQMRIEKKFEYSAFYDGKYTPRAGDLIFFTDGDTSTSCHVGIVSDCTVSTVSTIEGNAGTASASPFWKYSSVTENTYSVYDSAILGYYPLSAMVETGDEQN